MHKLGLVGGGHDHHVGQAGQKGDIERTRMGGAIGADNTRAVDGKADRKILDRHVMHHLVESTLQEGRVDGRERLIAFRRKPRGEGHAVLFGDAHIEATIREGFRELVEPGARRHGRGDGDHLVVGLCFGDQSLGEHLGVARRPAGRRLLLRAGDHIEASNTVELVGGLFRRAVALALLGDHMDQDRPRLHPAHIAQHGQQVIEIMAVDGADIVEAQLLEQRAAGPEAARELFRPGGAALPAPRQDFVGEMLRPTAEAAIGAARNQPRQMGAHGADGRRDRHVVVVQNHDQARIHGAGIVHRLIGHAGAHGAVANHSDHIVVAAAQIAGHGHAEPSGNRGRGVTGAKRVVFALGAFAEARQAVRLTQGADAVTAPGEDLMGVSLVANVPDDLVARGVEHGMQGDGKLDNAETGAEMAARDGDRANRLLPQLVRELPQLLVPERAQLLGRPDAVQQWRGSLSGHSSA